MLQLMLRLQITPLERESSELYYLSKILAEHPSESEREANHPQYKVLIYRYYSPFPLF